MPCGVVIGEKLGMLEKLVKYGVVTLLSYELFNKVGVPVDQFFSMHLRAH
eukprot:m.108468 g.108468  ORF g.108468 m.108468 type:complete len:50 (-) comp13347_c0_seq1:83-232(-)